MSEILSTASFIQTGQFEADLEGQLKAKGRRKEILSTSPLVESFKVVDGSVQIK
jgi:hypothetical protein